MARSVSFVGALLDFMAVLLMYTFCLRLRLGKVESCYLESVRVLFIVGWCAR